MRQAPSTAVVHHGITCDGCQQSPITGIRFKCRTCPDYDLCEACEAKNVHPADHPMVKFKVEKMRHGGHHGRHGGHHGPFGGRGHHGHPLHNLFRQAFQGGQPEGGFSRGPHGWGGRCRWLSRGAVGDAVKEIQQALKIQVDGFFGPKTEQAVKDFQAAQSLEADGIVGRRTRAKLLPEKEAERKDAPACGRPAWWLARGAVGDAVKEVQQTLGIQADGFFGPRTEQAVKDFQTAHSLLADGIVGPRTRAELTRVQTACTEKKEPVASAPAADQVAPEQASAPAPAVASAPESPAMAQLVGMGFANLELNEELLKKHNGDVEQVVAEILGA